MASFGTSDESNLNPARMVLFRKVDKTVGAKFIECRLNDIIALGTPTAFVDMLLDQDLLGLAQVIVWFSGDVKPTRQNVVDFFTMLGCNWRHAAGPALIRDEAFVAMRVMIFYNFCLELEATRVSGGNTSADPSDMDTPLDGSSSKTYDGAFAVANGRAVQPALLPPPSVLGNIKRQHESGVFHEIPLRYVVLFRTSADRSHGTQIISDINSGKQKVIGKAPTKEVKSLFEAYMRLAAISMGRLYIGGTFNAPIASFPGDATVGVVRGSRVHYDMLSHETYCALLLEIAVLLGEHNKVEYTYRFGVFGGHTMSATRAGKSFADAQADTYQQLYAFMRAPAPIVPHVPHVPKVPREPNPSPPLGDDKKRNFDEISKLPGFVPGLKTFGSKEVCAGLTAKDANKGQFCQFFTTGRTCSFGNSCKRAHLCDVKLADMTICLQPHTRAKHVADHGVPQY